ncbi:pre-mRNA-processing factor 19 [Fistulifera solaris]|uniref:Pre-mRNA-processing factor 19 n=1 Tax=Fistulifera solaris TaxID=1519565 RepID=A0A1Z5JBU9_FISSO|nr:pre-mRNA-processing factor 19 [Fistulifera solaris]|eukprot:GAX11445.1 pre-mRNA-processing factor 19 [Fistulifera solaris]
MLTCELSGEVIVDGGVVTPSGHVCSRRILLQKIQENGGLDPFTEGPLSEDDLIELKTSTNIPPRTAASFPSILKQLQEEYDAVLLELIDTRAALQETRQELSTALYQNDAAIRVIARLSAERDAARNTQMEQPPEKKRKLAAAIESQNLSENDLREMQDVWESLKSTRKARQKEASDKAWSPELHAALKVSQQSMPLESPTSLAVSASSIVGCSNKQLLLYDAQEHKAIGSVDASLSTVDIDSKHIVGGSDSGLLSIWSYQDGIKLAHSVSVEQAIVHVQLHPNQMHVIVTTQDGVIRIFRIEQSLPVVGVYKNEESTLTKGALHPDGLIYIVGTTTGALAIWDLKNQVLAGTMGGGSPVVDVVFSNNGYHIAAAHENGVIVIWDLRKQKEVTRLETPGVSSVCFDATGKFLVYGQREGVSITAVKQWDKKVTIPCLGVERVVWSEDWLVVSTPSGVQFVAPA